MREVDAKVEIGDCFRVGLVTHTAPVVAIVSAAVLVNYTGTLFSVRPFNVQRKSWRVGRV
jgi:hypothetical protein